MTQGKNLGLPNAGGSSIVDEDSKINMNLGAANDIAHIRLAKEVMGLLAPIQYDPLFAQKDGSGQYNDRLQTCAARSSTGPMSTRTTSTATSRSATASQSGIEDNYYSLMQPKGYRRKNAPYDSLEELHMVRGVSEDFWGTFIDPSPEDPKKRVVTVWGQGAVNVNTANAQTLLAIVCAGAKIDAPLCNDPLQQATFPHGRDDGARNYDAGRAAVRLGKGLHERDGGAGARIGPPHRDGPSARPVPVGGGLPEVDHDGEQDVLDLRCRYQEGYRRETREDPHRRRFPERPCARQHAHRRPGRHRRRNHPTTAASTSTTTSPPAPRLRISSAPAADLYFKVD